MAEPRFHTAIQRPTVEVNQVLRNTYMLLALTIAFACFTGLVAIAMNLPPFNFIVYLVGFFGLSFLVNKTANSAWGLFWTFVFTGFIGVSAAPLVGYFTSVNPGAVTQAFGVTAAAFLGLSLYTITDEEGLQLPALVPGDGVLDRPRHHRVLVLLRPVALRGGHLRGHGAHRGRPDPLPDERDRAGRRDQLHHRDEQPVRLRST